MPIDANPNNVPPAAVQLIQATNTPAVTLPNRPNDTAAMTLSAELATCANLATPRAGSTRAGAKRCLAAVGNAVRNGQISDLPAVMLALRGIPFTNAGGNDNVDQMSDILATHNAAAIDKYKDRVDAYLSEKKAGAGASAQPPRPIFTNDYRIAASTVINKPFSSYEIGAVLANGGYAPTADMKPNRVMPIDNGTVYMLTVADVVMNQDRYKALGKTLAQTIADARTRTTKAQDVAMAEQCMMREAGVVDGRVADLENCRAAAARNTAEMIINGQAASYDPSRYGIPSKRTAQR